MLLIAAFSVAADSRSQFSESILPDKGVFSFAPESHPAPKAISFHQIITENILYGELGDWTHKINGISRSPVHSLLSIEDREAINLSGENGTEYRNNTEAWLVSTPILLPTPRDWHGPIYLIYRHQFQMEDFYDRGFLKISQDGGRTWNILHQVSGDSDGWRNSYINIDQFAGSTITIGWHLRTDHSVTGSGWQIDHVQLVEGTNNSLSASLVNLESQGFPFIYSNVNIDSNGIGISNLTEQDFLVYENGTLQTENFQVVPPNTSGGTRLLDIVFIMDNSGSMSEEYDSVSINLQDFLLQLSSTAVDFALGLTRYGAKENAGLPIIEDDGVLTRDQYYYHSDVWSRNVTSGSMEPGYAAIVASANSFQFRVGSQRIFILIGDEPPGFPDQSDDLTVEEALVACQNNAVILYVLQDTNNFSYYQPITDATGGGVFNLYDPFTEILDDISRKVSNTYVLSYFSSDPVANGIERLVEIQVSFAGLTASCSTYYTPGDIPAIILTTETLDLHSNAQQDGDPISISALVTDAAAPFIQSVILFYMNKDGARYLSQPMYRAGGNIYNGEIPGGFSKYPSLLYYIEATDGISTVTSPRQNPNNAPYQIAILPNEPPIIQPLVIADSVVANQDFVVVVRILDDTNYLVSAELYFRVVGQLIYQSELLTAMGDGEYQATIDAAFTTDAGLELYIKATDDLGYTSYWGTADHPIVIFGAKTPQVNHVSLSVQSNPAYLFESRYAKGTNLHVYVEGSELMSGISVQFQYDQTKVEVTHISPGRLLSAYEGNLVDSSSINHVSGVAQIVMDWGAPIIGEGVVAEMKVRAIASNPSSSGKILAAEYMNQFGRQPILYAQGTEFLAITDLLGDFDGDKDIDFADYSLFVSFWNQDPDQLTGDIASEITGHHPGLPPWSAQTYPYTGDGKIDFEDHMVFAQMYRWDAEQGTLGSLPSKNPLQKQIAISYPATVVKGEQIPIAIIYRTDSPVAGMRVKMQISDPDADFLGTDMNEIFLGSMDNQFALIGGDSFDQGILDISRVSLTPLETQHAERRVQFHFRPHPSVTNFSFQITEISIRDPFNHEIGLTINGDRLEYGGNTIITSDDHIPTSFELFPAYPNPFNSSVIIKFQMPEMGMALLSVYDLRGHLIREWEYDSIQGLVSILWDGMTRFGEPLASGVYICHLTCVSYDTDQVFQANKKIVHLK